MIKLKGRRLRDLSWTSIVFLFADIYGVGVHTRYSGDFGCEIDYVWTAAAAADGGPAVVNHSTGLSKWFADDEESAKWLLQRVFGLECPLAKFKDLPRLSFDTKEELELKLAAAGYDVRFRLTHRCG